jgi:hypothetical protein
MGGLAFFKQNVAGLRNNFFTVPGEPEAIFKREPLQRNHTIERSRDGFGRCGTGRRG